MRRLLFVGLLCLGGCSFLDESPPGTSCAKNADCFAAQGETCDMTAHRCVAKTVVDAAVVPDGTVTDARVADSQLADGGTD